MAITYLCPAENKASGGVKVLYRHSEMLSANGFGSYIFHPKYPDFSCTWFSHNVSFRKIKQNKLKLVNRNNQMSELKSSGYGDDFIVIPEIWAAKFGAQCLALGLKYAIFVQNGYFILNGKEESQESDLKRVYERAHLIMSISTDTSKIISLTYPEISEKKIVRLLPNVSSIFKNEAKENIITYMPRKLPDHAAKVCFYLQEHLPGNWKMLPILDKNEQEVAAILAKSSIFMSFCDQEGCPLPPLEAAFSGNIVVGYTGQGAKEYFHKPLFREVQNGDFKTFIDSICTAIKDVEIGMLDSPRFIQEIENLKKIYSNENELSHLLFFASKIQ